MQTIDLSQEEAKKFVATILYSCQKAKSILFESIQTRFGTDDIERIQRVAELSDVSQFGKMPPYKVAQLISEKEIVTPSDINNLMFLVRKSEAIMFILSAHIAGITVDELYDSHFIINGRPI